jgi:hypothetical protein
MPAPNGLNEWASLYTYDWTMTVYVYPTTTRLYTLVDNSTPLATFKLLPSDSSGAIYCPPYSRWADLLVQSLRPTTVGNVILGVGPGPTLFYKKVNLSTTSLSTSAHTSATDLQTSGSQSPELTPVIRSIPTANSVASKYHTSATSDASATDQNRLHEVEPGGESDSQLGGGTIAGISIGIVLGILLVIGAYIILWRIRKADIGTVHQIEDAWIKSELDEMILELDDALMRYSVHRSSYQEPFETICMQEIASPEPRELGANTRPSELSPYRLGDCSSLSEHVISPYRDSIVTELSPHAQAQRLRELERLEMEEAKLRHEREQLTQREEEQSPRLDGSH